MSEEDSGKISWQVVVPNQSLYTLLTPLVSAIGYTSWEEDKMRQANEMQPHTFPTPDDGNVLCEIPAG